MEHEDKTEAEIIKTIITVIAGIAFVVGMGYAVSWVWQQSVKPAYMQPNILRQQQYLNSLDNERYACGIEDGIAGPVFCKALNNWCEDQLGPYYATFTMRY